MISVRSLPRLCVALGSADPRRLEKIALDACAGGEEFVELRLDMLPDPEAGLKLVSRLARRQPQLVLLATCRRREARGEFDGSIAEQERILQAAVQAGAQLVDVEIETAEAAPGMVRRLRQKARVVLSFHDFERAPSPSRVLRRLSKMPADIYKIAIQAVEPSDNQKLLALLDQPDAPPLVLLAMGEVGAASRLLAVSRGAAFGFAAPEGAAGTAPGQFPAALMRDLYRAQQRRSESKIFGVIADPVGHSLSPLLHNRAFQSRRVNAVYLPFLVEPKNLADFGRLAETLPLEGFSVTIPHKQKIVRRLAGVDLLARRIGAVNTVYRKQGKLWGTNTDAIGVTAPLEKLLRLAEATVLVVGTGGAARGAVFALQDKGARVSVTGRNLDKVRRLASAARAEALPWTELATRHFDVLVHATPVGMYPGEEENLFPREIPAEIVFDMVYNPLETALLSRANRLGKQTIAGLEMFLEQAAAQFEIWTGQSAPRKTMRRAVLEVLEGR